MTCCTDTGSEGLSPIICFSSMKTPQIGLIRNRVQGWTLEHPDPSVILDLEGKERCDISDSSTSNITENTTLLASPPGMESGSKAGEPTRHKGPPLKTSQEEMSDGSNTEEEDDHDD